MKTIKEDLGSESIWDVHYGRENTEKNVNKKIFTPKSQPNYVAKILTDVVSYFQNIHIQEKKPTFSEQNYLFEHLQEKYSLLPT